MTQNQQENSNNPFEQLQTIMDAINSIKMPKLMIPFSGNVNVKVNRPDPANPGQTIEVEDTQSLSMEFDIGPFVALGLMADMLSARNRESHETLVKEEIRRTQEESNAKLAAFNQRIEAIKAATGLGVLSEHTIQIAMRGY